MVLGTGISDDMSCFEDDVCCVCMYCCVRIVGCESKRVRVCVMLYSYMIMQWCYAVTVT